MDLSSLGIGLRNQKVFTKEPWVWEKENMSWKSENIERGRKALLAMVFCHSHLPKPGNVKMFYNTKKVSPKKFQLKEKIFLFICAHYWRNGNGRYFVFRKSSSYPCLRIPIEYPSHGLCFAIRVLLRMFGFQKVIFLSRFVQMDIYPSWIPCYVLQQIITK